LGGEQQWDQALDGWMNIPSHEEDRVRPNITKMGRRRKKRKLVN